MLACRRVRTPGELEQFCQRYLARGRLPIERAWLDRQRVVGFYRGGELVAGFVESDELQRSLTGLTAAEQAGVLEAVNGGRAGEIYELCALWMDERCGRAPLTHALVYATIVLRAGASGRRYLLVSAEHDRLSALYESLGGQLVWDSPSSCHPGHRNRIFFYGRRRLVPHALRTLAQSLRRSLRRRAARPGPILGRSS